MAGMMASKTAEVPYTEEMRVLLHRAPEHDNRGLEAHRTMFTVITPEGHGLGMYYTSLRAARLRLQATDKSRPCNPAPSGIAA